MELYSSYKKELDDHLESGGSALAAPTLPPLMLAYGAENPDHYMATMIASIKSSEIEQTLLILPFDLVVKLLRILETLLSLPSTRSATEALCRMFLFAVEVHFGPLSASKEHHGLLERLRVLASGRLDEMRDLIGFNVAAINFLLGRRDERQAALDLEESVVRVKEKRRKKKNKEKALQTAIMSL